MSKKKKKRTAGDVIRTLILILALGVFLFSAVNLVRIFLEYKQGTDEYDRMREFVTEEVEKQPQEEETEAKGEEVEEEKPQAPQVDWAGLQAINQDIIAWIQIEGTDISYPVVKGADNSYYLKHTFEGKSNIAGAIFIDAANSSDFEDCNTIVYGHNMKNGSMFGTLRKHFKDADSVPGKYIWICTPQKNYRYEIFSSHVVDAAGEVYTLFAEADDTFAGYLERMAKQSLVSFDVPVSKEDKIITLSTCTGNDATRFVVQARREGEY